MLVANACLLIEMVVKLFIPSDLSDFDNTRVRITFDPDELANDDERAALIRIFNDPVNEATEQVFVVQLRLINASNPGTVNLNTRPASLCRIVDDDGKCNIEVQYSHLSFNVQLLELDLRYHATHTWNLNLMRSLIQHLYPQQI